MDWIIILGLVLFLVGITISMVGLSLIGKRKSARHYSLREILRDKKK